MSVSSRPSRSDAAAPGGGGGAPQLGRQRLEALRSGHVAIKRPGPPQPALKLRAVALWEMGEHVSLLLADAALDGCLPSKHVAQRLAKRL